MHANAAPIARPAWLDLALSERGTTEAPGEANNPAVLAYFEHVGRPDIKSDATAWCAAAQGSWLVRTGYPIPPPNLVLLARTYEHYGVACEPKPGAIGVWPRGSADWQGHVATVIDVDRARGVVRRISGNLNNAVTIDEAPIETALAFRWPVAATVPALRKAGSAEIRTADLVEAAGVGGAAVAVGGAVIVEAVKEAPEVPPGPPPAPAVDVDAAPALDVLTAAGKALGAMLWAHPWVVGVVLGALVLLIVGRRMKRKRVARAAAGVPLSREALSE
jgi:uncharacterized protein (TIGR02594 family)